MKDRIYICHTFYHVYVTIVKELNIRRNSQNTNHPQSQATLILSTMSNDFGNLRDRLLQTDIFEDVLTYDEKEDTTSNLVMKYHKDRGNVVLNLLQRVVYTRKLGQLQEDYIPVDLKAYRDIYVYCDSDPIGYYLMANKIRYHAIEDGLDCIAYYDTARYSNRGHFGLKSWLAAKGFIFIENGYSKYCIDMEVNDISLLQYPTDNMIEVNRNDLYSGLSSEDRELLVRVFIENSEELINQINANNSKQAIMILTDPLCDLDTRKQIFKDIIKEYGEGSLVYIKPHPRDVLDYSREFPETTVISGRFPMEVMNDIDGLRVDKLVSVFTRVENIQFANECILLGEDFMDKYEAPEIHRQNEAI